MTAHLVNPGWDPNRARQYLIGEQPVLFVEKVEGNFLLSPGGAAKKYMQKHLPTHQFVSIQYVGVHEWPDGPAKLYRVETASEDEHSGLGFWVRELT